MGRRNLAPDAVGQIERAARMASRAAGVTNLDLKQALGCVNAHANTLLVRAVARHGLVRVKLPGHRLHFFTTAALRDAWAARQRAVAQATLRAALRLQRQALAASPAAAAKPAKRVQVARKPKAEDVPAPAPRPAKPAPAPRLTTPDSAFRGTVLPRREPAAVFAARPAVVPPDVKRTVYARPPVTPGGIDRMADPLPGVPGWPGGPVIRPGAMDFKRHQHNGGF